MGSATTDPQAEVVFDSFRPRSGAATGRFRVSGQVQDGIGRSASGTPRLFGRDGLNRNVHPGLLKRRLVDAASVDRLRKEQATFGTTFRFP
ncbi:MAG: hypothetical protein V1790_08720 [Planctomycetota bacterium]